MMPTQKTNRTAAVICICIIIMMVSMQVYSANKKGKKKGRKPDAQDIREKKIAERERKKGPTFPGKDPAFLVLPRKTERSKMPRELLSGDVIQMKEKALKYLAECQDADGGWSDTQFPSNTGVTALVCMAFMAEGSRPHIGRYGVDISEGLEFLLKNAQKNGIIAGKGSNPLGPMYEHAYATLALLMAMGDFPWHPETRDVVGRAVQALHESQKLDGGWRYQYSTVGHSDMSVTATVLWVLRTAKKSGFTVNSKKIRKGVKFIEKCALPDGTFRYRYWGLHASARLAGTAIISLCQQGQVSHPLIPNAINRIAYEYERYTVDDLIGRRYLIYGCFYASLATYVCGDEYFVPWFKKVAKVLKKMQRTDGEFWDEHDNTVYPTALAAILLQAPYGYFPLYER